MTQLKTNFILKSVNSDSRPILLILNFGYKEYDALRDKYTYKPLKYPTGISIPASLWDKVNKVPTDEQILERLIELRKTAQDVFKYLVLGGKEITPKKLKYELDVKLDRTVEVKSNIKIADFIEQVILDPKSNHGRTKNTLKQYKTLANKMRDYEKKRGFSLTTENLNRNSYLDFQEYLKNNLGRQSSVWTLIKNLKSSFNEIRRAYDIDFFNPSTKIAARNKVSIVKDKKVSLNFYQIQQVLDYQPDSEKLRNVKAIFVRLLFTGCRYSDVFKISGDHNYNKGSLAFDYSHYISSKTGEEVCCPILLPIKQVDLENGGRPPYAISDVKFNKYVKELVMNAGLTDDVTLSYTDAKGDKQLESKSLYEFVSSHIGRRSFVTNLINFIPVTILSKITGHKLTDKNVIFDYNQTTLEDNVVLFVQELERVSKAYPVHFPIRLV